MPESAATFCRRLMAAWVAAAGRHAVVTLLAAVALTVTAASYSVSNFAINTDTGDMLSAELDFRRHSRALGEAFPQFSDNILIVVDAPLPDLADDAGDKLAAALRENPTLFGSVYDLRGDPFFRKNGLLYLEPDELSVLGDRLARAQPFLGVLWRDPSLRGLFEMLSLAIDEVLKPGGDMPVDLTGALGDIAAVAEAQAAGRFGLLSWRRLMTGEDAPGDRRRLILIQPRLDFGSLNPAEDAMDAVRGLARDLGLDAAHGIRVRLTGSAALAQEELQSVEKGIGLAGLISLVVVLLLLAVGLRSVRLVLATLAALVAGLVWTAGFAFAAIGTLNLISVAFAVLFIGLSVDFGIHFALRYQEAIDRGVEQDSAFRDAAVGVGGAITLCAVAAAIGFFSFLPTDYLGLAELGLIAGVGMFIALVANLTVLPAVLGLIPAKVRTTRGADAVGRPVRGISSGRARSITIVAVAAGLVALLLVPKARFDFDPLNLKDPTTESVQALFDLMEDSRTSPYSVTVLAPDLDAAADLAERLDTLDPVDEVRTLRDYVPEGQDDKLLAIESMALFLVPALSGDDRKVSPTDAERRAALDRILPRLDRLANSDATPALRQSAAALASALGDVDRGPATLADLERRLVVLLPGRIEALRMSLDAEPVELDDLPAALKERQVAADGRAKVEVYPKENLHDRAALARFVEAVRTVAPEAIGSPVVILEAGNAVVGAFREAALLALVGIALLLIVLLRSVRDVLLVFAPLLLATVWTVAISVALGLPFNFANIIVLPLLFGLGVASAIHLVVRERDEAGIGAVMATSTPRAVVFSALTTVGSFASLGLSSHPGTASMGILLTVAIVCSLIAALGVLPALMAWTRREEGNSL